MLKLKASIQEKYNRLLRKYGVKDFKELEIRFREIPEEERHDDYFIAHNLEALRR